MNGNNNHPVDDKQHVKSLVDNLVEKVATETENSYITVCHELFIFLIDY